MLTNLRDLPSKFKLSVFSARLLIGLAFVFLARVAPAVTPWSLLVNTNNLINATSYGAVGDGVFTNTTAIQNAINQAAQGGLTNGLSGGTVKIPGPGIYLCGPLNMSNYVNLQIDAGVILRLLPYGAYPGAPYTSSDTVADFISASGLHDIAVSGPGAIDGQGDAWWPGYKTNNRPVLIAFSSCNRQLIQNITLSNSPMFHIAIGGGSGGNKTVQGVTIRAPSSSDPVNPSHNTDACNVGGTNILVQNCDISTGDDNFTCGGKTFDVLLTNNVYGTGHGVSIGSYTDGGVSNITVINCSFTGTDNGIRLKCQRGRGGLVQNLNYLNLNMTNVAWPLLIYSYYEYGLGTLTGVDPTFAATTAATNPTTLNSTTPIWRNITFSNINATMPAGRPPLMVWGLPEAPASNIVFRSVNITSSSSLDPGVFNATNVQFIDCSFKLPTGVNTVQFWNANVVFTNSLDSSTATNLYLLDGLTTNGIGNSLQFYNARGTLKNTNAFDTGPLTLSASTFTVSNNLSLTPNTVVNFVLSTNPATLAVVGNLTLGGTNNIAAGPGFTTGTYTLMTYSGALNGSLPVLATVPAGYNYAFDTNTAGQVKLVVASTVVLPPAAPNNLVATATNNLVNLTWSPAATATSYNVKRATVSGGVYTTNATVAATSYADPQVTNGTTYYYVVSAQSGAGEGTNSSEVSATPQAPQFLIVTTNVFNDVLSASTLNSTTPAAPGPSATSYELISSKSWSPAPSLAAGHLKYGIAATTSGVIQAQALFASTPVTLTTVGDSLALTVTFTNTSGLLTQSGALGFGLYNSGQNFPVPGGLNGTATTSYTTNTTGNAKSWMGYVGQLAFTNANSQILTRSAQTGTLSNNCQDVVTSGSGSSSYNSPAGVTVGSASSAASVVLVAGSAYTEILTITLTAANTLAITNALYSGTDTNGALLSQFGGIASGATFLTNSFDALGIGWRAAANTAATTIDINRIVVTSKLTVTTAGNPAPAAPANLAASATNLLIKLNWNSVTGATAYNLKRGTTNGGSYPTVFSGLTATNYSDANVTNAVTYYYVVTAVGAGGESTNSLQISAAPLPSNQPTSITLLVNNGQMQLSWPHDHLGWRLQIQTNDLATGLSTNWTTVPGATNANQFSIPIQPVNASVFLRLVYP